MLKYFFKGIVMLFFVVFSSQSFGFIIHIPNDANTIQEGIDIAQKGDTVLVDDGIYFENTKFRGKSITVASHFLLDKNPDHILNTIIDGSQFTNLDSSSCVLFCGEDTTTLLIGFTLQGGKGTAYDLNDLNESKYAGMWTQEGGGVLFIESDAMIKNNLIMNNEAAARQGFNYNGGGGISSFWGNPRIYNNVIMNNRAMSGNGSSSYGPGIVTNKSDGIIRNNIVYHNITSTGGAIFIDIKHGAIIENNTIVANNCPRGSGGFTLRGTKSTVRNNIIWGNSPSTNQIDRIENSLFEYCISEQEFSSRPTIYSTIPTFDERFQLLSDSPGVDLGNPDTAFNDIEDNSNPGYARFPSLGETRNDIGAYGGPHAEIFPDFHYEEIDRPNWVQFPTVMVNDSSTQEIKFSNLSTTNMIIDSITVTDENELSLKNHMISECRPIQNCILEVTWKPLQAGNMRDTLKIFHHLTEVPNPVVIKMRGTAEGGTEITQDHSLNSPRSFELMQNFPNPFNLETKICFQIKERSHVILKIYNITGGEIQTLVNQTKLTGKHTVFWGGTNKQGQIVPSGLYFYHLKAGEFSDKKKMMLLK